MRRRTVASSDPRWVISWGAALDGWVCLDCRSVNNRGAGRCYKCHVPRKFGEAPDGVPLQARSGGGAVPPHVPSGSAGRPRPTLADYRSSRRRSWYVLALLTATVGFSTLSLAMLQANGGTMGLVIRMMQRDLSVVGSIVAVSSVGVVLTVATAIAWFVWFDRVLQNVPPLTGRWTEQGRAAAVTWWLVPLVGLFRGPYIVGQVYDRVRVRTSPGLWLLGLWAVFWLGGTVTPAIASRLVGFLPLDLVSLARAQDLIAILGQVSYVTAGLFAAALVLAFEQAQAARSSGASDLEPDREGEDRPLGAVALASAPGAGTPSVSPWAIPSDSPWAIPSDSPWATTRAAWPASGTPAAQWAISNAPPTSGHVPAPTPVSAPLPGGSTGTSDGYMIGVIPAIPLAIMGGAIALGLIVGVILGHAARPTDMFAARPDTAPASTDLGRRTVVAAPGSSVIAADQPTPAPFAPAVVARDVVGMFTSEDYRGGMGVQATLIDDNGTANSSLDVMRSGDREWSELHLGTTDGTAASDLERVILGAEVWERTGTSDWVRRDRSGRDRVTPPILGLTDPDDLEYVGMRPDGETNLHAFRWGNRMTTAERSLLTRFGVREPIRTAGTLLVTAAGEPVRSLLSYTGVAGRQQVRLDLVIEFQDVMARILIRSPRAGPPVLVRVP